MHTYHKRYGEDEDGNEASTWVVFLPGDPGPHLPLGEFMTEELAAAYASYLNGGAGADVSPTEARKQIEERAEKIKKAKADKEIKALEAAAVQAAADAKATADAKAAEVKAAHAPVDASGAKAPAHEDKNDKSHATRHK
jgi:hypothetical protein